MGNHFFRFRHFTVFQQGGIMPVSSESVLLGAWCRFSDPEGVYLDLGCGSGLLSLILIQKGCRTIHALDINRECIKQCKKNFFEHNQGFTASVRLHLHCMDFRDFSACEAYQNAFDGIISNPPYFSNSLKSKQKSFQNTYKHQDFEWSEFFGACQILLKPEGRLVFVCPVEEEGRVNEELKSNSFIVLRHMKVSYKKNSAQPSRILFEIGKCTEYEVAEEDELLCVYDKNGLYSEKYLTLIREIYEDDWLKKNKNI